VTLRFLLDEDIAPAVAAGLRRVGIDCLSVYDPGSTQRGASDAAHLVRAAGEGRVLVTFNRKDFQALHTEWQDAGLSHAGIL